MQDDFYAVLYYPYFEPHSAVPKGKVYSHSLGFHMCLDLSSISSSGTLFSNVEEAFSTKPGIKITIRTNRLFIDDEYFFIASLSSLSSIEKLKEFF